MADETATRLDNLDVAYASGWHVESTDMIDVFKKGDTVIEVRYTMNDDLDRAVKRRPNGDTETIGVHTTAKVDRLRSWLTGDNRQHRGERFVSAGPTSDRSQLYSEFWHQFRNRVAAEHPDWRARAGTSRTAPNATLPGETPRTLWVSAFKPGPLRLELAFVHPDSAVNLARFEALRAKKGQLERALGGTVTWDEMAGKNDTRVYIESSFESIDDRDQWPTMMDWLVEMHVRFKEAVRAVGTP
ncbi:protein of unknown function [Mycolicibacterium rutilum]|uniref:DUF4268 domain-containing protein n=1 Tax=Mycolicibacterium rutilum TaxID=370526 RepID=A0A1H6IFY6_MYCRU|nr:DUF4268 domain-containing protein [Mycolicibacterium rutilum]SEH47789.1 protein of unknown function [Mycolicibacterium rutilum]